MCEADSRHYSDQPSDYSNRCCGRDQPNSRHVLLNALVPIVQNSMSFVKVFVTSRDNTKIHALLPDAEALRVKTEHTWVDMYTLCAKRFLQLFETDEC